MSKGALARQVLANRRIHIYACGRRDIETGRVDRRVLATLEFLAASGLAPTVSSLTCGHGYLTASGNVSEHSSGNAVDIAAVNGIPILGHQGEGSITDIAIRRLLTLQGAMKPHQIISLMTFDGVDNTVAMADHDDHIHVGFQPRYAAHASVIVPGQWIRLIERLGVDRQPDGDPNALEVRGQHVPARQPLTSQLRWVPTGGRSYQLLTHIRTQKVAYMCPFRSQQVVYQGPRPGLLET